jgi:subtilisin family serine protease
MSLKYSLMPWVLLIVVFAGCTAIPEQSEIEQLNTPLLLVIDDPRSERERREIKGNGYAALIDYESDPMLSRVTKQVAKDYDLVVSEQWPLKSLGVHCIVIESPSEQVLRELKKDRRVKWVQAFNQYEVQGEQIPNQANFAESVTKHHAEMLESTSSKGKGVDIVVIDTGADYNHPSLKASNLLYKDFAKRKGIGHKEAHGTAVVGLIAAQPIETEQNVANVTGFSPQASVHHFRGCWQDNTGKGKCNTLTLALALDAAVAIKPDLINLSLSGPSDIILEKIVEKLIQNGSIIVTAFDEKRALHERFPNAQPGVIYAYGVKGDSPQLVPEHSLVAPANALSLAPNGEFDIFTGHSIATPHLTSLAANFIGDNPQSTQEDMVKQLKQWFTKQP